MSYYGQDRMVTVKGERPNTKSQIKCRLCKGTGKMSCQTKQGTTNYWPCMCGDGFSIDKFDLPYYGQGTYGDIPKDAVFVEKFLGSPRPYYDVQARKWTTRQDWYYLYLCKNPDYEVRLAKDRKGELYAA